MLSAPVRDRLTEFLPLLLLGVVLLAFQLTRPNPTELPTLPFLTVPQPTPAPVVLAAVVPTPATARQPAPRLKAQPGVCTQALPRFQGGLAALKSALGA